MAKFSGRMPPDGKDRKRLVLVAFSVFFLFSLLIIQFYRIQILEGDKWKKKALAQHQIVVTDPGKRGLFYSNTSIKLGHPEFPQPFVIDVSKYHLYVDPEAIPAHLKEPLFQHLVEFLQLQNNPKEKEMIRASLGKKSRSRKIASWLNKEVRDQIEDFWRIFSRKQKFLGTLFFLLRIIRDRTHLENLSARFCILSVMTRVLQDRIFLREGWS